MNYEWHLNSMTPKNLRGTYHNRNLFAARLFFYIAIFGLLVSLSLPVIVWTNGATDKLLDAFPTIAFFLFFSYLFRSLRSKYVTAIVGDQTIRIPKMNFSLDVSELAKVEIVEKWNGGRYLRARTRRPSFLILIGHVTWIGYYLDISLGNKK